ncbi:ligase-associated DNA damage response DEXH box helicase [Aquariibacter albus]|uniref:Ligase-associated DNA damage response DEXH box helicase n=1 Tax=Aquariibacter albus TaxID=2759899 RepID=A0A839HVK7_9BURK|nr:ligase-associated DNA damage response DEXH box helicase [Aquariibacter albus]MBB1162574.1 ligase-associated DNA damage response DEXH box helicase [Aquariibacter albus]
MPSSPAPSTPPPAAALPGEAWFAGRGWQPFPFQRQVWAAMAAGRSGLLHASTGSGKTYAVALGALARAARQGLLAARSAPPLRLIWVTPMRALAADTLRALQAPLADLAPAWTAGLRSGDTPAAERARQDRRWPSVLVTTPESLSLMLAREHAAEELAGVDVLIADEWHELIASKRGVQLQLALARLRGWNPGLLVWGLSATLGNLAAAGETLLGAPPQPLGAGGETPAAAPQPVLVQGRIDKTLCIDTLLPARPGRFSWAGHLGRQMLAPLVAELDGAGTALVFTNTRSQAEIWYQLLLEAWPDWAGLVALHHGSLDPAVRAWVEAGLKEGQLKAVVATASLDLGVDFLPVERVLQIGSAKGIARLLQRAGRSGHAPGRPSRLTLVPTNTLELLEAVAARRAVQAGRIEPRHGPEAPLDVLVQHLVTVALGGGFPVEPRPGRPGAHDAPALFEEVRRAPAYRQLGLDAFRWALDFVVHGGASLGAYPEYHRVRVGPAADGSLRASVPDRGIARRHRMAIGTIVSEASMQVVWARRAAGGGGSLGSIEEGFIARLQPGDAFVFAGRLLELVRVHEMRALVRPATARSGTVPTWQGGKMPLSTELADAVLEVLESVRPALEAAPGREQPPPELDEPELRAAWPMLATQVQRSRLPTPGTLLVEHERTAEGFHVCIYPFAGRHVHLGLASLLAWRWAREQPNTFSLAVNDLGFELLAAEPPDLDALGLPDQPVGAACGPEAPGRLWSTADLLDDVLASLATGELAQRRFREIARVAGLVFTGYPGAPKSTRQLQASSKLFYEVFRKHDAGNRLLGQAETEVLAQELDLGRLQATLQRVQGLRLQRVALDGPSPFSLPLRVERLRERLSTEQLAQRLDRMLRALGEADAARAEGLAALGRAPEAALSGARSGAGRRRPGRRSAAPGDGR